MIKVIAPAKINLVFQVGKLESNGYHPVNSLYLTLDLFEELALTKAEEGSGFSISVVTDLLPERHINAVPRDKTNLVYQVAERMFDRAGIALADLEVHVLKRIPVAGGMAGGSADAAAMMVAVNQYLAEEHGIASLNEAELIALAAEFGSDVPFSLLGGLAVGRGRGDKLEQLEPLSFETHWVIVISSEGLSTPAVYAKFDQLGLGSSFTDLAQTIGSIEQLADLMANDLEAAAISLSPGIAVTKERLLELGSLRAMVSGSGPSVIGLFRTADQAAKAAEVLGSQGFLALTASASYVGTRLQR